MQHRRSAVGSRQPAWHDGATAAPHCTARVTTTALHRQREHLCRPARAVAVAGQPVSLSASNAPLRVERRLP